MNVVPVDALSTRLVFTSNSSLTEDRIYAFKLQWSPDINIGVRKVKEGERVTTHFFLGGHETCQVIISGENVVREASVTLTTRTLG